jgi:hypothetical protein
VVGTNNCEAQEEPEKKFCQTGLGNSESISGLLLQFEIVAKTKTAMKQRIRQFKIRGSKFGHWRRDKLINGRWRWGW